MKKIIITVLIFFLYGTWVAFGLSEAIPKQVELTEFENEDILFLRTDLEIATTTDENGIIINSSIKVPIKYNFPVATSTDGVIFYIVEEIDGVMEMNFGGYNQCREKRTKEQCLQELRDDIESNVETFKLNREQELRELKIQYYSNELILEDL